MAYDVKKLLAIIDPTTDKQRALRRALHIARRTGAAVHAFLACHSTADSDDHAALERAEVDRHTLWLASVLERSAPDGVQLTSEVVWSDDWRATLAAVAASSDCDAIIKSTYTHSATRRRLLKTSDWALLRAARCPVLLVKRDTIDVDRRILIATNPGVEDPVHQDLNATIVAIGRALTEGRDDLELHAVCAYAGSDRFTHPPDLALFAGIDEDRAHCKAGDPHDVIVDCAKNLRAELVIVGDAHRSGLSAAVKGNTAERLLDRIETDVLVVAAATG